MPAFIDLTGQRFGRLTVLNRAGTAQTGGETKVTWSCRCDCGEEVIVWAGALRSGHTKSCGCLDRDQRMARNTKHGASKRGETTPEYLTLRGMIDRCTNPNNKYYADYGGRGIEVCERWRKSFANFLADMGERPKKGRYSIERLDVNGHYEPGNCVWIPMHEQATNKRNNRLLTFRGQTLVLTHWAERIGISVPLLLHRLDKLGWPVERALTEPARELTRSKITFRGETMSMNAWAKRVGMAVSSLHWQVVTKGRDPAEVLAEAIEKKKWDPRLEEEPPR
jgi:hypothetical protein